MSLDVFELVVPCSLLYILTAVEFSFHPSPRVFFPSQLGATEFGIGGYSSSIEALRDYAMNLSLTEEQARLRNCNYWTNMNISKYIKLQTANPPKKSLEVPGTFRDVMFNKRLTFFYQLFRCKPGTKLPSRRTLVSKKKVHKSWDNFASFFCDFWWLQKTGAFFFAIPYTLED